MTRKLIAIIAALAVALTAASVAASRTEKTPKLDGTVGPGYSIKLKKSGKKVKSLKAGSYKFVISDRSNFHSFELEKQKGGKFEKELTSVNFTGKKSKTIDLTPGKWKYYCKPHESQMFGYFKVTK